MTDTTTRIPTDADIIALADKTRTGEPGRDGYILPISFARAVLAKWGAPAPAASEAQPVAADDVIFLSGKAAGRQEVKDEQQNPDFWTWIRQAYREPESTKFTIYNMEVAYQAGRETAAPSGPAREPLADEQIEAMAKPFVRSLGGDHWYSGEDGIPDRWQIEEFARAIEAEVRKQDESLIRQMLEALECNGEPDGPGHRCSHCDDYVDRNSVLRYAARKRLESKP